MKNIIHRLASMKIAVVLLVLILAAMAAGTIVESMRGTEAAARTVYYAPWFQLLLWLFAVNVLLSLVDLWPWGVRRIGFVLTHGSMLVILLGAFVTDRAKQEGQLALWEGEESARVESSPAPGATDSPGQFTLPFSVRLDSFEIDYYQGTRRPAMFRSRVTVRDADAGRTVGAVIEMNRELSYAGYRFFQSSYQQTSQGEQSVLLVSRDPGQPIVFTGYFLLMIGMGTVLTTRVMERRILARAGQRGNPVRLTRRAAAMVALGVILGAVGARGLVAGETEGRNSWSDSALRRVPVQHDGRVMPLDTMAREAVWKITGRARFEDIPALDLVLGWSFEPHEWIDKPMVAVPPELVAAIGLPPGAGRASFRELSENPHLVSMMEQARAAENQGRPLGGILRDAERMDERLSVMRDFLEGTALRVIPSQDRDAAWSPATGLRGPSDLTALVATGPTAAASSSTAFGWELAYNDWRPARLAWGFLVVSLFASLLSWKMRRPVLDGLAAAAVVAGFSFMTFGLAARWIAAGRIPASNMYESLLFLGWGVGLFAVISLVVLRNRLVVVNATAMAALTMALVDLLPIDPFIHPMPPVLSGTPWLAIHVPIIMISYSVLAIGVLVAHMQIGCVIVAPARRDLAFTLSDLLYWYIHIGSILLIAGILTGSIWAASSWGRYWGWDPKEVWSLVAFLAYLAILHGRFDRLIGTFGVALLSIVAFWTILMTYLGVNFVLTTGMHAYGSGGHGVVRWMLIIAGLEGMFLFFGVMSQLAASRRPGTAAAHG